MNLAVTDAMQELRPSPAFALGHQMMTVGLRRRDHPVAQGTPHCGAWRRVRDQSSCRDGQSWSEVKPCSSVAGALKSGMALGQLRRHMEKPVSRPELERRKS
jgi:hypothetical protein